MSNNEPAADSTESQPRSEAWKTALTVLQSVKPPSIPDGAEAMTVVIDFPPGDPGTPAHLTRASPNGHDLVRCGKPDLVRGVRQRVIVWTEVRMRPRA
jgi:hypothetical protein